MFKKKNSENLLSLINREEPMPASRTVHKLLNLDLNLDLSIVPASALTEIETIVSPYTPRPLATKVKYDAVSYTHLTLPTNREV